MKILASGDNQKSEIFGISICNEAIK